MSLEHSPSRLGGERLLTDLEVEQILGVARGWAAKDRCGKALIQHVKFGRCVRYRLADVEAFIAGSVRQSTSDTGAKAA